MTDAQTNGASTVRASTLARRCLVAFCLVAVAALSQVFAGSALAANDICGYAYLEPHGSTYGENGEIAEYNLVIQESEPQGSGFIYLGPVRTSGYTEDNVPPWKSYRDSDRIVEASVNGTINPASMSSWFRECSGLRSINLKGVSGAALTDMSDCFWGCDHLASVSFSGVDTSHVTRMDGMFTWCDSLESLDLSPLNTSHVTNMNNMFSYCSSLRDVGLSSLNTSQVSDMSWMFAECSSLPELDLARFNTSNATNMSSMFFRCRSLKSLDLSSFDTRKVEKMSSMFEECPVLTSVNVSSFDVSRVGDTSNMFESCSSLRGIDLSSFSFDMGIVGEDGESPIRGAFGDCGMLSTLTIGPRLGDWSFLGGLFDAGVTWRCVSDGEGAAFEYGQDMLPYVESKGTPQTFVSTRSSDDIVAIALSDGETLAIRTGQRDLAQGERLLGIATLNTLPWSSSRFSKVVFENRVQPLNVYEWFSEVESLSEIDGLGNFVMPEDGDLSGMFSGCESLSQIDLSALDTAGATDMRSMFANCRSLRSLDLSSFDTSGVTDMTWMFSGCESLNSLDLSSFDTSSVTDMLGLFDSCSSLESVDISSFRTTRVTTLYAMFRWCESLRAVDLSRFDTSHVTDIGDMFNGCTSLRELDLSPFDTSNVTNMGGLFRDCPSLERLDVSHFDFGKVSNIDLAFSGCTKLGKLSLGSIDFTSISSTENVFDTCVNLNEVKVASRAKFKAETFPEGMWRSSADGEVYRSSEVPSGVAATYTRVSPSAMLYALLDAKGALTITATRPTPGPGDEVFSFTNQVYSSSDETPWSNRRNDILAVRVLDAPNVSAVAHWFDGCVRLASADLTGLSSDMVNDTMFLFADCTSLREASLPAGLHLDYSVAGMFSGCSSLTSVSMPAIDVEFVHDFDEMFRGCSSLVELDLSGFDTRQAESMKRMFHGCRSLQRVKLGPNFTFRGNTYSRLPGSELPDGAWQPEGVEARAYASDSLPSFTEATYVKVDASTPGLTVESLRGDTADGKAKYSVSTTLVEGTDGLEAVSDYELDPAFASDTFMVGETASASSTATLTSRTVTRTAVGKVSAPARVTHVVVGSQVRSIKERAFADALHVTQLTVKSTHLTKKARVYRCLTGSKVTKVHVKMSSKYAQKVATALRKWACK